MGRNNADFQGSVLYHGSPHAFEVGDVILPQSKSGYGELAYAAESEHDARYFGKNVYTVTPVKDSTRRKMEQYDDEPEMYEHVSKDGFRVVGKI
jgi:hypothetical protein